MVTLFYFWAMAYYVCITRSAKALTNLVPANFARDHSFYGARGYRDVANVGKKNYRGGTAKNALLN
jgi:hypothetical protein